MKKSLFSMLVLLFVGLQSLFAQTKEISGVVTSADDGLTLPGVSVIIKGTTIGTTTDFDGQYILKVATESKTLVFSFVGMTSQEVAIKKSTVNVVMSADAISVDEVVIVGYSSTTRKAFTGTATSVSGDKLAAKSTPEISKALTGEVSGVQVINSSGQPGSVAKIRIRGFGSVNGNRSPLYVVDGLPFQGDISTINPGDVASTTILKDASATAIYGSRGANGVIVITTKSGKKDESSISVDAKYGVNMRLLPDYNVISSPERFIELTWEGLKNTGLSQGESNAGGFANANLFNSETGISPYYNMWNKSGNQLIDPTTGKFNEGIGRKYNPEKWSDHLFDQASLKDVNVKMSGGSDKTSYYTSFGFLENKGYYINSDYKRYTTRVNVKHKVKPWLNGSVNMSYSLVEQNQPGQSDDGTSGFWFNTNIPSIYPVYLRDIDGNLVRDNIFGGNQYDFGAGVGTGKRGFGALNNPVSTTTLDTDKYTVHELSSNSRLEAKINKNFKVSTRLGLQYSNSSRDNLSNPFYGGSASQNGSIFKSKSEVFSYTWLTMLNYLGSYQDHNFSAFIAHENSSYEYKYLSASKSNLVDPTGLELNNGVVSSPSKSYVKDYKLESYFGQLLYDYSHKYYAQFVLRRDGSSRFANEKWGTFGSLGLSWVISEEEFIPQDFVLNNMKIKTSYGLTGEQAGIGYYPSYDVYDVKNLNDEISTEFKTKGNKDLTWETSKMFQLGVEFGVDRFLEASIDFYHKKTVDLFFDKRVAPSLGYAIIKVNDGDLVNKGLEFDFTAHIIDKDDMKFDVSFNGAFSSNELTAMPIETATGKQKVLDQSGIYGRSKGHSLFDFYTREFAGVDAHTGKSTWNRYYNEVDGVKDYILSMTDYVSKNKIGTIGKETTTTYSEATSKYVNKSAIPLVQGAFRLSFEYKGFDLSTQFLYSIGGYSYDGQYASLMGTGNTPGANNWHTDIENRWTKPGDITDVPRLTNNYDKKSNSTSDRFLIKSDYLSLNNIKLGYTLPSELLGKIGVKTANVWVSGDNLLLLTKRDGFNPSVSETGAGSTYTYTPLSSVTVGLKFNF